MRSALLIRNQESGRFPDRCVLTGETTETAVYIWAIETPKASWVVGIFGFVGVVLAKLARRRAIRMGLPITQRPWGMWKRRANLYAATTSAGFGFILAGYLRSTVGLAVFGLVVAIASRALRMRALQNYWISAELKPEAGHILIGPTHPDFDEQARELFRRST